MLDARGTVFYACGQYIGAKRPSLFLLENVKGLLSHDGGATFEHVMMTLREIGGGAYNVEYSLLNTETQGLPTIALECLLLVVFCPYAGTHSSFRALCRRSRLTLSWSRRGRLVIVIRHSSI